MNCSFRATSLELEDVADLALGLFASRQERLIGAGQDMHGQVMMVDGKVTQATGSERRCEQACALRCADSRRQCGVDIWREQPAVVVVEHGCGCGVCSQQC